MIKIAICDDEKYVVEQISTIIQNYSQHAKMEWNTFLSGEELLKYIKDGFCFDLIFLDIEMKKTSGIDFANILRNEMEDFITQIVFVTAKENYAKEACSMLPLDFVDKPFKAENITRNIDKTIKILGESKRFYIYFKNREEIRVAYNDIYYFKSEGRKMEIVTKHGRDVFYERLMQIENQLKNHHFVKVFKSFIVNEKHINQIQRDSVIMNNGEEIPVSRDYKKNLLKVERW